MNSIFFRTKSIISHEICCNVYETALVMRRGLRLRGDCSLISLSCSGSMPIDSRSDMLSNWDNSRRSCVLLRWMEDLGKVMVGEHQTIDHCKTNLPRSLFCTNNEKHPKAQRNAYRRSLVLMSSISAGVMPSVICSSGDNTSDSRSDNAEHKIEYESHSVSQINSTNSLTFVTWCAARSPTWTTLPQHFLQLKCKHQHIIIQSRRSVISKVQCDQKLINSKTV